jgi:hypothetical protein
VLLLAPSAELWTGCLRHRTQILYLADISMAVAFMELRPGCVRLIMRRTQRRTDRPAQKASSSAQRSCTCCTTMLPRRLAVDVVAFVRTTCSNASQH